MSVQTPKQQLLEQYAKDLALALDYLEYSLQKVLKLPKHRHELNKDTLEGWESFSARYARATDLFTNKYIRTYVAIQEPGFRGSTKDLLNQAEKHRFIDDASVWSEIRELRNYTAHEYSSEAFDFYIERLLQTVPEILKLKARFPL